MGMLLFHARIPCVHIIGVYSAFRLACIIPVVMVNAVQKLEIQEKWMCCSSDQRELCLVF